MSWKETLNDACRSYDAKDLEAAKRKAKMAMREAATVGGEEGAKAVEEIHSWLNILEEKLGSSTAGGKSNTQRPEKDATASSSHVQSGASAIPPSGGQTVPHKPSSSNKRASEIMQGLCGFAGLAVGYFTAHGPMKSFIDTLRIPHEKPVYHPSQQYKLDVPVSSGDGLIDLINWLIGTAAVIAVVWTSVWIGAGIGRLLAFLGSASMEGLEELANKEEQRLQGQSNPVKDSNATGSDSAKGTARSLGDVIAEFFRSRDSQANEAEEARRRQDAANLQRFYPGVPLEDAWERSQLSFKGNFIEGTKQWRIDALDAREKTYIIVYQDQVMATITNLGGSLTDRGTTVGINQSGQLHFREMHNGTMITFRWLPPAFGPDDVQLLIKNGRDGDWQSVRTWVEARCASVRNTPYVFIDSYLVPPKLGGQTD